MSSQKSSGPSASASRPVVKKSKRSAVPNERISPAMGSATDRTTDPVVRSGSSSSTPAPGSSSKSKRVKVSARSVAIPASSSEPTTKSKTKKIKRVVHVFGPSKNYVEERKIALSQLTAPCVRNFVAAMVASEDLGVQMNLRLFDEITRVSKNHSLLGTCSVPAVLSFPSGIRTLQGSLSESYRGVVDRSPPATKGSYKLKPQRREDVDAMLTLDDFPGVFDDELTEEFRLEEEEEARSDSEMGSASEHTELPPMPEGSPPAMNEPPLPSEAPPVDVIPDPPVDDSPSLPASASTPSLPRVGEKRGREVDATTSAELPPLSRPRTEAGSDEGRKKIASESRTVPEMEGRIGLRRMPILREVGVQKGDLQKALEAEVESSKARDLILQSARKAEEVSAKELAELRADYDQLSEVGAVEVKLLRDRLFTVKERFRDLRAASETRLGKLKAYLDEREFVKEKYLLFNQMKGVFGTIERLKTLHAIDTPPIFERRMREMEGKLERWLGGRPQLSYEASDFELPAELEVDSILAFLGETADDDSEKVLGGAVDEGEEADDDDLGEDEVVEDDVAGDRGAGDANSPEE
ncbi:unnamed protein product [Cochlearia groenlandica]